MNARHPWNLIIIPINQANGLNSADNCCHIVTIDHTAKIGPIFTHWCRKRMCKFWKVHYMAKFHHVLSESQTCLLPKYLYIICTHIYIQIENGGGRYDVYTQDCVYKSLTISSFWRRKIKFRHAQMCQFWKSACISETTVRMTKIAISTLCYRKTAIRILGSFPND